MGFDESKQIEYLGDGLRSDSGIIILVSISIIFHCFIYSCLSSKFDSLLKSYIVSTVHALICVTSVTHFFLQNSINFYEIDRLVGGGRRGTGDETMIYTVCYSLGYFIYDLCLMFLDRSIRTKEAIFHHIIIIFGFSSGILYRICHPCHFYFLAEEFSTIPLNFKTIYRHHKTFHRWMTIFFVFSFFFSRIFYGSIIFLYGLFATPQFFRLAISNSDMLSIIIGIIQIGLCLLTRILNFYWANLIRKKIVQLKND